ncbi:MULTISPECIES: twin-arginine translocase subunit TatC [Bacteria]|uniref:twin-arginine translocase subunit TatC n=1 Tax=Bacteria TaxID=2 RepID=UPI001040547C|nr:MULTISPECIES: twin-arginine translocase subunit TatC [Bacteria]QDM40545.1 twin-arginine translocase subunit TatC [Altererythrobacter sp. TH136]TCJ38935.1 twin-arginine translocase subunit TatC [Parafrankia sp. BMG5.11]
MVFSIRDIDQSQAPLLDHLIELRARLLRAFLALAVAFGVCFYFAQEILGFLVQPLLDAGQNRLIYTKLYGQFFVELKVALFAAFFLAFPIIANQLWAFVAPGLYAKEKKAFLPFLLATPVLFVAGGALAYYVVMPTAFVFFLGFEGTQGGVQIDALPNSEDYLSLVMQFIMAFGLSFLLPVLLLLLNTAGIVSRAQLVSARRYMIVAAFVVAAVATPPDVISQLMLAIPLLLLFEGALAVMWFTEAKAAREKAADETPTSASE